MSFSGDLRRFRKKATENSDETRRAVAIKLFSAIIRDTPVLTGRLRGNWQTTVRSPAAGEIGERSEAATLAEMASVVDASGTDVDVFLTNNLPYAYRIEYEGWSKTKAPEGMVRRNIVRFDRLIKEEARKVRR